jgi:hypothetical protein
MPRLASSSWSDFTYEGSRSITGPYLGLLGASALTISVISGAGELIGYNVRLFSWRSASGPARVGDGGAGHRTP